MLPGEAFVANSSSLCFTGVIHDQPRVIWNSVMRPFFVIAIAFATAIAFFGSYSRADEEPSVNKFAFQISDLSNQNTRPFRFGGEVMSEKSGRWKRYRREIDRYPNAVPCLSSGVDEFGKVDLRDFNWTLHTKVEGLDVCIFRILDTLQSVVLMEEWIASQGFSVSPNKRYVGDSAYVPKGTVKSTHYIEGSVPYGAGDSKASKALSRHAKPLETLAFSLNVYLDRDANIAGVRVTPRTQ